VVLVASSSRAYQLISHAPFATAVASFLWAKSIQLPADLIYRIVFDFLLSVPDPPGSPPTYTTFASANATK
jgi:hypothetical protein